MKSDKLKKLAGALLLSLLPIGITAQNNLISALQCSSTRPAFAFTIQEAWTSSTNTNIDTRYTPLAGDIDGDGNVEVFAANGWGDTSGVASILYVFEGKTGALAGQINCPGITTDYSHGALLFKRNASAKGTVFIAGRDGQIYLYEVRNSTRPLQFDLVWQKTLDVGEAVPAVADLNGDGNVELVAGKYIIDANTGNLLSTLAVGSKNILQINIYQSFPLVANVDGDSYPEVIVGTCVYKFNTGFVANPTAWRTCPRYGTALEGANMAADINQDGSVDIVNISVTNSSTCDVTVWTPATNTEIGRFSFSVSNSVSYPFVGDMDGIVTGGKKYPEICINTAGTLRAYAFNGTNFVQKWSMPHTDTSGATALTLFDFNNDGVVELVYRDETHLRIFDGSGNAPVEKYAIKCGSATIVETPIVADVTGDGSADIIVTGDPAGVQREIEGEVMVFEGGASKWASSPHVWNQQLYSNLLVNEDLTIPSVVLPVNLSFTQTCPGRNGNVVQYYNGGPMQAPYISEETYCPIDLSSDIFIVNGSLSILSSTTVEITITVGNQGAAVASSSTPIRFYQNSINTANVLTAANTTLGVDLVPGQTTTITRTITLPSIPPIFFARVLDDGTNFPALGAFSDCDLTNNTKSFGTLELTKEVDQLTSCLDNIRKFTVKIQNDGTAAYNNIQLIDSLGIGWDFISITPSGGTSVSAYNPVTRSITWTIPTLAPGDSTVLIILAQTTAPGDLRNYSWISSVGGTQIERDFRSAYTIVSNYSAPSPPVISPADTAYICPPAASVLLTASPSAVSYQWYKDGIPIPGATSSTYPASAAGKYSATLFDGTCTSNMSDTVTVLTAVIQANNDYAVTLVNTPVSVPILDNDNPGCCGLGGITNLSIVSATSHGTATIINDSLIYTPNPDYVGKDSVAYTFSCSGIRTAAKVYITVTPLPDNIDEAECFTEAPETVWDIEKKYQSAMTSGERVQSYAQPFVGDLDGDGNVEIVTMNYANSTYMSDRILIFNPDLTLYDSISVPVANSYVTLPLALADVDGDGEGEIIYGSGHRNVASAADQYRLHAFHKDGTPVWKSTESYMDGYSAAHYYSSAITVADLDGDGRVEILAGDRVFAGESGALLATLPAGGRGKHVNASGTTEDGYLPAIGDINRDGIQEIVCGNTTYRVTVNSRTNAAANSVSIVGQINLPDGYTSIADIDGDGILDVVVVGRPNNNDDSQMYAWQGTGTSNNQIGNVVFGSSYAFPSSDAANYVAGQGRNGSRPFIGDIDGDGKADIAYTSYCLFGAFRYNKVTNLFELMFRVKTSDTSAATTMSLFDFNLDGEAELVYRDETLIRIIDKTGSNLASFDCRSGTHTEYPVVADLNRDGHAEIIVSGADPGEYPFGTSANANCRLMVFGSITPGAWAPARKVWNQHAYNATNINEDLSVPQFPMNNAAIFAGPDDVTGTADDVQPFNSFLQQQTILNRDGEPLYKTPDAVFDPTLSSATFTGDSVTITLCVVNQGDAPIGNPLYVTLYRESIAPTNIIVTVDTSLVIQPGDTGYVIIAIPHITPYLPLVNFAARVNDDGVKFTVVQECDSSNNEITILNPAISLMMKKKATLNTVQDNGTYPNPVSVLFSEEITYEITAVNANTVSGDMIITDTLPPYLDLVTGSYIGAFTGAYGTQATIRWEFLNEPPMSSRTVGFKATPVTGAVASQPLFINRAWVKVSDTILVQTNSTYHQGAGVAVVTFSTSLGGWIFNASEQALDYRTSPRPGIQVIPEEGYEFAGWSHDAYTSLRGIIIPADSGIYSYEDVIIHGNVELSANFVSTDRSRYTGTVENEEVTEQKTDKIWAVADNLYVTPFKEGSVLRIYTLEGVLREQHTLVTVGTSTYELPRGIYIVTVNKGTGKKIIIHP